MQSIRTGIGYDVHKLVPGSEIILGGIKIPCEFSIEAHSDGDVLCHSIMDAMLGAAGLGDIGEHFPDTDAKLKGASSMELLKDVNDKLKKAGMKVANIDAIIILEKPKISEMKVKMKEIIANVIEIDMGRVNIKATTTEKLGSIGRSEGIASQAVVTLEKMN